MTKIQKESNSQPARQTVLRLLACCDLWQRYKKKAIHNICSDATSLYSGVVTYDKDTKRKQFTTPIALLMIFTPVLWPMTKIQKESNSQPWQRLRHYLRRCCDLWQRYKKKAIHNLIVWINLSRLGVVTYDKDTKRKQFTTSLAHIVCSPVVLWPMTKIQKESNSQLSDKGHWRRLRCCDLWQRYKKKAIHNVTSTRPLPPLGVVTYDKDTKRKQFTTLLRSLIF